MTELVTVLHDPYGCPGTQCCKLSMSQRLGKAAIVNQGVSDSCFMTE